MRWGKRWRLHQSLTYHHKDRWLIEGLDIQLIEGNVEQLPCLHDSFEFVLGESILAFTEKERVISECYRVLQKDGKLVVIEMIIDRHIEKSEEEKIARLYGMNELLTENEWVQLFQKANFKRIIIAGGGTIAETISAYIEEPEWNVSQFIPNELYEAWVQHENVRLMYQHILGHRIFICEK
ncbi:hypothetical protein BC30102_3572 [Bacillus cereus]|nr:hypothetical protein BC30102_3572 [Bacillus cereus]